EADEPDGEGVDADVVRDAEVADAEVVAEPLRLLRHLELGVVEVEPCRLLDPEADLDERDEHRKTSRRVLRERQKPDGDRAGDRQHDEERCQKGAAHLAIRKARTRTAAPAARKKT